MLFSVILDLNETTIYENGIFIYFHELESEFFDFEFFKELDSGDKILDGFYEVEFLESARWSDSVL